MRPSANLILILGLGLGLALPTGCRPEKTTGEKQGGASASSGGQPDMGSTPEPGMVGGAAMDFSLPPGEKDRGRQGNRGNGGKRGNDGKRQPDFKKSDSPAELKAALATLDRVGAKQKHVLKVWQAINTVADAQKHKQALLKGVLDVLKLTIISMKKAVTLSKAGLAKFLAKQETQRVHTRQMNETIKAKQRHLTSLPGGKAFFDALKQSATVEVRKHSQDLMTLGRQLLKRKEELKR